VVLCTCSGRMALFMTLYSTTSFHALLFYFDTIPFASSRARGRTVHAISPSYRTFCRRCWTPVTLFYRVNSHLTMPLSPFWFRLCCAYRPTTLYSLYLLPTAGAGYKLVAPRGCGRTTRLLARTTRAYSPSPRLHNRCGHGTVSRWRRFARWLPSADAQLPDKPARRLEHCLWAGRAGGKNS